VVEMTVDIHIFSVLKIISPQPVCLFHVINYFRNEFCVKGTILWDITLCSPLSVNRRLEEHITSIFRVEKISLKAGGKLLSTCFQAQLIFFDPEDEGDMFLQNVDTQQTTRCYIPEDGTLHNHCREKPQILRILY
jgi:hypothetical protein